MFPRLFDSLISNDLENCKILCMTASEISLEGLDCSFRAAQDVELAISVFVFFGITQRALSLLHLEYKIERGIESNSSQSSVVSKWNDVIGFHIPQDKFVLKELHTHRRSNVANV